MDMEPERIDLTPLDPAADRLAYERLVRGIVAAAGPELRRRAAVRSPLGALAGWARPTLAAASVIVALALGALVATDRPDGMAEAAGSATVVEAMDVPEPAAEWLQDDREPTRADLVLAMERPR